MRRHCQKNGAWDFSAKFVVAPLVLIKEIQLCLAKMNLQVKYILPMKVYFDMNYTKADKISNN